MTLSEQILDRIAPFHLLGHPFYQSWTAGTLEKDTLQEYAKQYYAHVSAFPRYISATHSMCEDIESRQFLFENLGEEEGMLHVNWGQGDAHHVPTQKPVDHPELWMRFAEGTGATREAVQNAELLVETNALIDQFFTLCRSSYAEGLAGLFTYEYQIPEIAVEKIAGLKKFYNVSDDRSLLFFEVHKKADVYHRETCQKLLDALPEEDHEKALQAAEKIAQKLWNFLSGIQDYAERQKQLTH